MKNNLRCLRLCLIVLILFWSACKKDKDPVPEPPPVTNEEEVITTMQLSFTDSSNSGEIRYASFKDPDGDGGGVPVIDTIKLAKGKTWITKLLLLNETKNPADTVSNEVLREGVDHLFCYTESNSGITVIITDSDVNNRPIGLQSRWKTPAAANGTMQVLLKHQPGSKDGSCTPGETDVDVTFQVRVE